jgi:hypothetical protein
MSDTPTPEGVITDTDAGVSGTRAELQAAAASVAKLPADLAAYVQGDGLAAMVESARTLAKHLQPAAPAPTEPAPEAEPTPSVAPSIEEYGLDGGCAASRRTD